MHVMHSLTSGKHKLWTVRNSGPRILKPYFLKLYNSAKADDFNYTLSVFSDRSLEDVIKTARTVGEMVQCAKYLLCSLVTPNLQSATCSSMLPPVIFVSPQWDEEQRQENSSDLAVQLTCLCMLEQETLSQPRSLVRTDRKVVCWLSHTSHGIHTPPLAHMNKHTHIDTHWHTYTHTPAAHIHMLP